MTGRTKFLNPYTNSDETIQEWSFDGPLQKMLKWILSAEQDGYQS
jgi:hypothetical protein